MVEIKNIKNFNLNDTVTCGQIFRYQKEEDDSYTIILKDRVINVKYDGNNLYVDSNNEENLKEVILKYFDLDRDYSKINKILVEKDNSIREIVESCTGLKMINSYPFETIISYIISANNSVPSIKKSVDMISQNYGDKISFRGKDYYLFPTPEELKGITASEYRKCSVGFRDKYIEEIVKVINNDPNYLENFNHIDSLSSFEILLKEKGIGPKVASCILLFAYQKFDVFPVDTWVKKVMKEKYNVEGEKNIREQAKEIYGEYSGIAIQYMFHYGRNR
ncbi:MAG: DNA-3-methyladenine glycosylase family protein [Bacilli bacterium]